MKAQKILNKGSTSYLGHIVSKGDKIGLIQEFQNVYSSELSRLMLKKRGWFSTKLASDTSTISMALFMMM